jgi:hypothetical protein
LRKIERKTARPAKRAKPDFDAVESVLNRLVDVVFGGSPSYIVVAEIDPDQETFRLRCKPLNGFWTGSAADNSAGGIPTG